jgi:hypothetical protein
LVLRFGNDPAETVELIVVKFNEARLLSNRVVGLLARLEQDWLGIVCRGQ